MALVRVARVASLAQAVRDAAALPPELVDAVLERLEEYVGKELDGTRPHVERLTVTLAGQRRALTAAFFVDTDGTLNVLSLGAVA